MPIGEMWNLEELSQKCKSMNRYSKYCGLPIDPQLTIPAQPSSLLARRYMLKVVLEAPREQLQSSRLFSAAVSHDHC